MKTYIVKQSAVCPNSASFGWDDAVWSDVQPLAIDEFRAEGSSSHKPKVEVKGLYHDRELHFLYRVEDCYIRSVHTKRQESVCLDSCVEFFVWPFANKGYVNFEMNCGGTLLSKYYADPDATPAERHKTAKPLADAVLDKVTVNSTLPRVVDPELTEPTLYFVHLTLPVEVLESVYGDLGTLKGQEWRANFFKCGDETSHPHWVSWNPIGEIFSFHQPHTFGRLIFE